MESVEPFEMNLGSEFEFVRIVGMGAFGLVCEYVDRELNCRVAVKKVLKVDQSEEGRRILREILCHTHLRHPNILRLLKVVCNQAGPGWEVYLVTELMDSDLHKLIKSNRSQLLNSHVQFIFYQLFCSLQFLESANIVHRDVKPSNIFINADCSICLADFGMARALGIDSELTTYIMNRSYRAPEVMLAPRSYSCKIDVWAAGCCLYEVLVGEPLFVGEDYLDILNNMFKTLGQPSSEDLSFVPREKTRDFVRQISEVPSRKPSEVLIATRGRGGGAVDPLALDLLDRCLEINPAKRISASLAVRHGFFAGEFKESDLRFFAGGPDFSLDASSDAGIEGLAALIGRDVPVKLRRTSPSGPKEYFLLEDSDGTSVITALPPGKSTHQTRAARTAKN